MSFKDQLRLISCAHIVLSSGSLPNESNLNPVSIIVLCSRNIAASQPDIGSATDNVSKVIHVRSALQHLCVPVDYGYVGRHAWDITLPTALGHTAEAKTNYARIVIASSHRAVQPILRLIAALRSSVTR